MKTLLKRSAVTLNVALASLACAVSAIADDSASTPAMKNETFKGTVMAVNQKEGTVAVKHLIFTERFNVADNCKVTFETKPATSWTDLKPGQEVEVRYQDAQGVLVAHQITQHNEDCDGYITAIDPGSRALTIKDGLFTKKFAVSPNCAVTLNDKSGSLDQLRIGHTINISYETENGLLIAQKIEQPNETFTGTVQAIDAKTRIVKAKNLMSEKKFNLADGCKIVVANDPDGKLKDLRIGERVTFSYADNDGVLVANRIGAGEPAPHETESAQNTRTMYPVSP